MDSQVAFFCGDSEDCLRLGSEESLARAEENIEAHYITVGVLELLEESLAVLECLLPDYFTSLTELHQNTDLHMRNKHNTAGEKRKLTQEAAHIMTQRLHNEFRLYEFIKRRIIKQYKDCQKK